MELRCVVAVIRHGDRTPKQKMKLEVKHPKFFEIFGKYDGYKKSNIKLKKPKQLQVTNINQGQWSFMNDVTFIRYGKKQGHL